MTPDHDLQEPLCRIACAALRHKSGAIICGVRHYDPLMRAMILELMGDAEAARRAGWYSCEEGFADNKFQFLTRDRAWTAAERAGQIRPHPSVRPGRLHSEDIY